MNNFNSLDLGAIDILVISEISRLEKEIQENNYTYLEDRHRAKLFLQQLNNIHNKINGKETKGHEQ